ncbi:MAG: 7-carboxy-7-deazaguanine synthase [Phycisphaerae bacterium]|nr:7-carboxy-7-deazaguanine synthase [Phycisphaerae bacterium]
MASRGVGDYAPGMKPLRLRINEIFHSVQGEGTRAGVRCVFVRLTGCHLRCTYCDTEYAFYEGGWQTLDQICDTVRGFDCPTVEITGGEPLLQPAVFPLMTRLADACELVMLETSGAVSIAEVDPRVVRIVDLKCPSSGEVERNHWPNVALLTPRDEVKFVIGDRADYEWSRGVLREHRLSERCTVLFSPVFGKLAAVELASWLLADRLDVRLNLQLHKFIWPPATRGV